MRIRLQLTQITRSPSNTSQKNIAIFFLVQLSNSHCNHQNAWKSLLAMEKNFFLKSLVLATHLSLQFSLCGAKSDNMQRIKRDEGHKNKEKREKEKMLFCNTLVHGTNRTGVFYVYLFSSNFYFFFFLNFYCYRSF